MKMVLPFSHFLMTKKISFGNIWEKLNFYEMLNWNFLKYLAFFIYEDLAFLKQIWPFWNWQPCATSDHFNVSWENTSKVGLNCCVAGVARIVRKRNQVGFIPLSLSAWHTLTCTSSSQNGNCGTINLLLLVSFRICNKF